MITQQFKRIIPLTVAMTYLVSCGTILYPERRGQKAGRIDPAILILDGAGLLLFLVPGVIAFAVDFATGAIYLPSGKKSFLDANMDEMLVIQTGETKLSARHIEEVIYTHTGKVIDLNDPRLQIISWDGKNDVNLCSKAL